MLKVIVLGLFILNLHAEDLLKKFIQADEKKITVICFYTTWCPACNQTIDMLNDLHDELSDKVTVVGVDVGDEVQRQIFVNQSKIRFKVFKKTLQQTQKYGVKDSVPVILLLNEEDIVIKRLNEVPNKKYFFQLVKRLSSGYLENGTMPIENRVDLWKNKRN